jgi:hypothetical protein
MGIFAGAEWVSDPTGTALTMKASDRLAVWFGSVLSLVVGVWGLASVPLPIGLIGGAVAAVFGLAFGVLAILSHAWGRWRKTALAGIAVSGLALVIAAAEVVYLLLAD